MTVKIGNKTIEKQGKPFIAAEAGINHNGSLAQALLLVEAAKEAGADAIKFQTFKAKEVISDPSITYTYTSQGKQVEESMLKMLERCELLREDWIAIKTHCDKIGITFFSSPQNVSDLEILLEVGVDVIKVGSDDFTNTPLLKSYSETGLPMILSIGMANLEEVKTSLETVGTGYPVILCLCTSQYPAKLSDININKLDTIIEAFPGVIPGFSDHSEGHIAAVMAVVKGAVFFEKHFTLDHELPGPDHWFSEDPESFKHYVKSIRDAYIALGSGEIKPTETEKEMRILARRSIVAIKEIQESETFTEENLAIRRPGNGIPPSMLKEVLGKKAAKKIEKWQLIQMDDLS